MTRNASFFSDAGFCCMKTPLSRKRYLINLYCIFHIHYPLSTSTSTSTPMIHGPWPMAMTQDHSPLEYQQRTLTLASCQINNRRSPGCFFYIPNDPGCRVYSDAGFCCMTTPLSRIRRHILFTVYIPIPGHCNCNISKYDQKAAGKLPN
jgi:hypothetical protein